jgi:hypothetical protein
VLFFKPQCFFVTRNHIGVAKVILGSGEHDEYTVRVANNVEEAAALIEADFEYVTGEYDDGGKIFKRN